MHKYFRLLSVVSVLAMCTLAFLSASAPTRAQNAIFFGQNVSPVTNNIIQANHCGASSFTNVGSLGLALNGSGCLNSSRTPAVGDWVAAYWYLSATETADETCSDTNSNAWTVTIDETDTRVQFWAISKLTTGGNTTLTCNFGGFVQVVASAFVATGAQNVLDGSIKFQSNASGTSQSAPSITTSNASDAILGGIGTNTATSISAGAGYTVFGSNTGGTPSYFSEYRIVTSAASYTPTFTFGTSGSGYSSTLAVKST